MSNQKLNLLSLDGGGVRGLSSLYVLQRLMLAKDPENPPKPCDYFDMIGGTSTGGLIAIMLGRLRMSVEECIEAYIKLSERVFQQKHVSPVTIRGKVKARYSSEELQNAVQEVIQEKGFDKNALLKDTTPQACKVFVCATSKGVALSSVLRSYPPIRESPDLYQSTRIWEAACATSAASSFFDPIAIGPLRQEFLDGGTGANNPIRQLWNEASDVFCDSSGFKLAQNICTMVSIGTGVPDLKEFGDDPLAIGKTLLDMSTETETTAAEFHRSHSDLDDEMRYYRFNVARGLAAIGLEEAEKAARIKELTDVYLAEQIVFQAIRRCAKMLGEPIMAAPELSQQTKSLVKFPEQDSERLLPWLKSSGWHLVKGDKSKVDFAIFDRISTYDAKRVCRRLANRKSEGTTEWLRTNVSIQEWLSADNLEPRLWISGKVGSGKSTLMTTLVEESLRAFPDRSTSVVLAYFYELPDRLGINCFRSLVKQLLAALINIGKPCPRDICEQIEEDFGAANRQPEINELLADILIPLLATFAKVIIILDGVDCCEPAEQGILWRFLSKILDFRHVRLVISSQDGTHVDGHLPGFRRVPIDGNLNKEDIETYIDSQLALKSGHDQLFFDPALRNRVRKEIQKRAQGMFLWVHLVLYIILNDCTRPKDVMRSLSALPGQLEEMYKTCLLRTSGKRPLCDSQLLYMVCVAPTPMQEQAIRQLLAMDKDTYDYTEAAMISTEDLVLSGVGLVTFDLTERIIIPVHDSVRSFIFSDSARAVMPSISYMPDLDPSIGMSSTYARELTAKSALGYLCLRHIKRRATRTLAAPAEAVRLQVPTTAFSLPSSLQRPLNLLFPRTARRPAAKAKFHPLRRPMTPAEVGFLQYATDNWIECNREIAQKYFTADHWELFSEVALEQNESWNVHPWSAQTPNQHRIEMFAFSVAYGHVPLLKLVLAGKKALPERIFDGLLANHEQLPALHVACKKGHAVILALLLTVCDVNVRCHPHGRYALHYAAESGNLDCCRVMAQAAPQLISALDLSNSTPLHLATQNGHQEVVEFWLRDDNTDDFLTHIDRRSLLASALSSAQWHLLDFLMGAIEPNQSPIDTEYPAFQSLSMSDHPISTEKLAFKVATLRLQGHPNDRDENGLTLLWYASATGFAAVIRLLLGHPEFDLKKEIHTRSPGGETSLCVACKKQHLDVIQLLMSTDLIELCLVQDSNGWLPIDYLAFHHAGLRFIQRSGVSIGQLRAPKLILLNGSKHSAVYDEFVVTVPNDINTELQAVGSILGQIARAAKLNNFRNLGNFLQAAAETNHIDAVKYLLLQWKNLNVETFPWSAGVPPNADSYIQRRGLDPRDFSSMGVDSFTFPMAIYLAAMKQHKEVLDLLLQVEERCPASSTELMERARRLRSYPGRLDINDIRTGAGGWFPRSQR